MKPRSIVLSLLFLTVLACRGADAPDAAHSEGESWAVTAWGVRYEVFAETDALAVGQTATSNAHVTILAGFAPLEKGVVTAILRDAGGREQRFRQDTMKRSGVFSVEIKPTSEGLFDLAFAIETAGDSEVIPAGRVKVGSPTAPGGPVDAPEEIAGVGFLKEQQWKTAFATQAVAEGSLREGVAGPAKVLPARGGVIVLTASVDAIVAPEPWPYTGLDVAAGAPVFRLRPRAIDRSLPDLTADVSSLEADAEAARKRVARLEELLRLEATSAAELERARAASTGLDARLLAARRGVEVASGSVATSSLAVSAPWPGRVAEVSVSPGQAVSAGTALGRFVRPRPLWVEVALRPADARRLLDGAAGLVLRVPFSPDPIELEARAVRLVAIAPEVDSQTATLAVTLEIERSASELPIGSAVEAEILLAGERRGIVVPHSALIDDAGVSVAYVHDSGESFSRREVRVRARQGLRVLVDGLKPGERIVTEGAAAIRRSSLLSSGAPEGHVH